MTGILKCRFAITVVVLGLGLLGLVGCQPPAATDGGGGTSATPSPIFAQPEARAVNVPIRRDLSQDESAGGHILRKHVGQTDEQLRQRLGREHRITGASTYTDRSTAEHAVGAAIAQSRDRISNWLNRPGGHPNLVLDYDNEAPVGRTINRGESQSRPCAHALVVLRYVEPNNYYVLTSYPECRP
jgi:hypothetical protein